MDSDYIMKTEAWQINRQMKHFEQICRNADVKLTHQRIEIFREVALSDEHPDAETVFLGVRSRLPTISLDTVYRALWLFSELGLITRLGPHSDRTRFDANLEQHHHFVCSRCGLTRDFYSEEFNDLKMPDALKILGQIETTHVEVRGICGKCSDSINK